MIRVLGWFTTGCWHSMEWDKRLVFGSTPLQQGVCTKCGRIYWRNINGGK